MSKIGDRFYNTVRFITGSTTQTSNATLTAKEVTGSKVVLLAGEAAEGLTYRWTVGGTKTGANTAWALTVVIGTTTVLTLTSDAATAGDWMADVTLRFISSNSQKVMGKMLNLSEDPVVDYAAATVDCKDNIAIKLMIAAGHTSDTVTSEICTLENWTIN